MTEDFLKWHQQKSDIDQNKKHPFIRDREIWSCALGRNIGHEQNGSGQSFLRPVLIIKKINNSICIMIPLTRQDNKNNIFLYSLGSKENPSFAIISQVKLIDTKRLIYKIGKIDSQKFFKIKEKLRQLFT